MVIGVECMLYQGEPLKEVDCFKYLESQVAADRGCERDVIHRMNAGYRAWEALKSLLSNRGLGNRGLSTVLRTVLSTAVTAMLSNRGLLSTAEQKRTGYEK